MKVKISRKYIKPQTQTVEEILHESLTSAHEEIERLFQENKDLRVDMSHTQDELKQFKSRFATACADRDNWEASFKQMTSWWEEATAAKNRAQNETQSIQIELKDREERIFVLEQRIAALEQENKELRETADALAVKVVTQSNEISQYKGTVTWAKLKVAQDEVSHLRGEVARLTVERDAAIKENTSLIFENSELEDELEAAVNLKNDYAEQLDAMRKERDRLHHKANDATAGFWSFLVEHGIVKTEEEMGGGNVNET